MVALLLCNLCQTNIRVHILTSEVVEGVLETLEEEVVLADLAVEVLVEVEQVVVGKII
jgi:hypothetical protein